MCGSRGTTYLVLLSRSRGSFHMETKWLQQNSRLVRIIDGVSVIASLIVWVELDSLGRIRYDNPFLHLKLSSHVLVIFFL